ncbi:MAG TPA: transposase [Gemmataceae bacterium]|nr:transposase [Gemmataceae bacterium]
MLMREAKAIELADRGRAVRDGAGWVVFSLNGPEKYRVTLEPLYCSCPDFETRHEDCKHTLACKIAATRPANDARTEQKPETPPVVWPRKTYSQPDWVAYEAAQVNEKDEFLGLLHDLCSRIEEPARQGRGRRPVPLADAVYAACLKVFTTLSVRRFMSDLREAHERGFLSQVPHNCHISRTLESDDVTPILESLIVLSSLPLKAIETEFAVDATGFSASKFDRWYSEKYGRMQSEHTWVKAHAMTGTTTHVVTSVVILDKNSADGPQFPSLVKKTARNFTIRQMSGDKAYTSTENFQITEDVGGVAYLSFKPNTTAGIGGIYERMFHLFSLHKEEYLKKYHRRSNIESVFSAVKRVYGDSVRSKTPTAMKNEVLAKLVCHNISQLIHLMYELGIEPNFGDAPADDGPAVLPFRIPG